MTAKLKVEVFIAGCPACDEAVALVQRLACGACQVTIQNLNEPDAARRAGELGIRSVPTVVVDGQIAPCCRGAGPTEAGLRAAGIGEAA